MAGLGGVSLHGLETGLGVLENAGALADGNSGVACDAAIVPRSVLVVGYISLVGLYIAEAEIGPIYVFLFHTYCFLPSKITGNYNTEVKSCQVITAGKKVKKCRLYTAKSGKAKLVNTTVLW
ncbi:hypothetical protein SDC9_150327 [bioreactor metagenome]|uniref:Uncharacterized protein n=1 Tax=bioreactor metagenome TaxID=1076179 RepID=A0A645ER74_9ZZZZ